MLIAIEGHCSREGAKEGKNCSIVLDTILVHLEGVAGLSQPSVTVLEGSSQVPGRHGFGCPSRVRT